MSKEEKDMIITPKELRKLEEIHEMVVKKGLSSANELGQTAIFFAAKRSPIRILHA